MAFQAATTTIGENDASTDVVVVLTTGAGNMLESAATFNVVATNGTTVGADYAVPATITFNANSGNGDTTPDVPLTFNPTDDLLVEGSQSVTLTLTVNAGVATVTGGTQNEVTITDADSASVAFQAATTTIGENDASTDVVVVLTTGAGNMLESAATFNVVATNGTTVGADYAVPATITFNANSGNGDTTPDVPLTFNPTDDLLVEGSQSVTLTLTVNAGVATVTGGTQNEVTITDADSASVAFQAATTTIGENDASTDVVVVLTTGAGNMLESAATFNVVATNGTTVGADYAVPATITFNANSGNGDTTPDVPLTFNPTADLLVEGDQSVTLTLTVNAGVATVTGARRTRSRSRTRTVRRWPSRRRRRRSARMTRRRMWW